MTPKHSNCARLAPILSFIHSTYIHLATTPHRDKGYRREPGTATALKELMLLFKYTHDHVGTHTHTCTHGHAYACSCTHTHRHTHAYRTKYNSGRSWEMHKHLFPLIPHPKPFSPPRGWQTQMSPDAWQVPSQVQREPGWRGKGQGGSGLASASPRHHLLAQDSKDFKISKFEPDLPAFHKGLPVKVG